MYRLQSITRRTATNCVRAPDNLAYLLTKTNTESFRRTRAPALHRVPRSYNTPRFVGRSPGDACQFLSASRPATSPHRRRAPSPPTNRRNPPDDGERASERAGSITTPRAAGRAASPRPAASCCPSHGPRAEEALLLPRRPTDRPSTKVSICCALADERDRFCRFLGRIAGMQCFDAAYFYATHVLTFAQRIGGFGEDALYKLTFYITFASDSSLA